MFDNLSVLPHPKDPIDSMGPPFLLDDFLFPLFAADIVEDVVDALMRGVERLSLLSQLVLTDLCHSL